MISPAIGQFQEARKQELIRLGVLDPSGNTVINEYKMPQSLFTGYSQLFRARRIEKAQSLWRDIWFENECACLFGDPGVGKSSLAYLIAEQVADEGHNVIYIDFDNIDHQYTSKGWRRPGHSLVEKLTIRPDTDFADAIDYKKLLKSIEVEFLDNEASVIVIDDISYLCPMHDCERTRRVLQQFRLWLRKYFVSILVVAHARKHPEGLPLSLTHLTGSRQLAYAFDSIFTLNEVTSPLHTDVCTHYVKQLKARNSAIVAHAGAVVPLRFEYVATPQMAFGDLSDVPENCIDFFKPYYRFVHTGQKVSERELINIPNGASQQQIDAFIHRCDANGWSIRQIAEHTPISKSAIHRILTQPKSSEHQESTPSSSDESSTKICPIVPPSPEPAESAEPVTTTPAEDVPCVETPLQPQQEIPATAGFACQPLCESPTPTENSEPSEDEEYEDDDKPFDKPWDPCAYEEPVSRDPYYYEFIRKHG